MAPAYQQQPHTPVSRFHILLSILTGRPLVCLVDFDGEHTVRLAWKDGLGRVFAQRMHFVRTVQLFRDGSVGNGKYVLSWFLVRDGRRFSLSPESGL